MSNSNNSPQTGIQGNSPAQINTTAAPAATAARTGNMSKAKLTAWKIALGVFIILTFILLNLFGISFTWVLILGAGLIWGSKLLQKKPEISIASTAKYMGWAIIIIALLASGPGQWLIKTTDTVEASVNPEATGELPFASAFAEECETVEGYIQKEPTVIILRKDCSILMNAAPMEGGRDIARFDILKSDTRYLPLETGSFIKKKEWVTRNGEWHIKVTPNPAAFTTFADGSPITEIPLSASSIRVK